jgi:hypothetical protein
MGLSQPDDIVHLKLYQQRKTALRPGGGIIPRRLQETRMI